MQARPDKLLGTTIRKITPLGTAYITINCDSEGIPLEIFVTIGKAGSNVRSFAESIARLVSLHLRKTEPSSRLDAMRDIISEIEGIGGENSMGLGPNRVLSLPDAIAKTFIDEFFDGEY